MYRVSITDAGRAASCLWQKHHTLARGQHDTEDILLYRRRTTVGLDCCFFTRGPTGTADT